MKGFMQYLKERHENQPVEKQDANENDLFTQIIKSLEEDDLQVNDLKEGVSLSTVSNAASMGLILQLNKLDREAQQQSIFNDVQTKKTPEDKIDQLAKSLDKKLNRISRLSKYSGFPGIVASGLASSNRKLITKVKSIKGK